MFSYVAAIKHILIAILALLAIAAHLILRFLTDAPVATVNLPLYLALVLGGGPLIVELLIKLFHRQFGSDLLAGISIATALLLDEPLAGVLVVLMLSGGEALERMAIRSARSALSALAKRMPAVAHRLRGKELKDIDVSEIAIGDQVVIYPHEVSPVDGTVIAGQSTMDESYLTGEPFLIAKTPGSEVISGAVNGQQALTIEATRLAVDSRYSKIMSVMRATEERRPKLQRLGDTLGAWYTPLAVGLAVLAWAVSGDPVRFLSVLVVATPCPLLIAIPVAVIGAISLSARRGIIVKDAAVFEQVPRCRTIIFDKTGTLTYGSPELTDVVVPQGESRERTLQLAASVERYSKHPLAAPIVALALKEKLSLLEAQAISERPGQGLSGEVDGSQVLITSRKFLATHGNTLSHALPPPGEGLECLVVIDRRYAALFRFRDEPRSEGASFIRHLRPRHRLDRVLLVSGDRRSEVEYLARKVGIDEVHAEVSPEGKVAIVRQEMQRAPTVFLGDGINDAPAMVAATVGLAFGQHSDVTAEAAGAVIMESSLARVDEFFHISSRMRSIALQSAVGGMALSVLGMCFAGVGLLPPVAGALTQEFIDLFAVANALRAAMPPRDLTDF